LNPSIGRIVQYTLSQQDADAINKRRADFQAFRSNFSGPSDPGQAGADGHVAHVGNHTQEGDVYPAMIVRIFGETPESAVNLQVFLDGNDAYWATSRTLGEGSSHWAWPERV
jgi:hypothetical protein